MSHQEGSSQRERNVTYLPWVQQPREEGGGRPESAGLEDQRLSAQSGPQQAPGAQIGARLGAEVHPQEPDETQPEERSGFDLALRLLARKDYSERALREALLSREVSDVEETISKLQDYGYLDDDRSATAAVQKLSGQRLPRRMMVQKLVSQGYSADTAARVMAEAEPEDETVLAAQLLEKKRSSTASLDRDTAYRRLSGFLLRRGFSSATVSSALREFLGER